MRLGWILGSVGLAVVGVGPIAAANHAVTAGGAGTNFSPKILTIAVGDTVTWSNAGGSHNVHADDNSFRCSIDCGSNSNPSASAWSFQRTFATAGDVDYYCDNHGGPNGFGMSGTIHVGAGGGTPGSLRFSGGSYNVSEGGGSATITVQRTGGDDGAVSVHYATANGSASSANDYTATSGDLDWADGNDDAKTFQVAIDDDDSDENNETVQLALSAPGGGASLGSPASATLTILDDDDPPVGEAGSLRFTAPTFAVGESDGAVEVSVERIGGTEGAVGVTYAVADGTATAGSDYTDVGGILTFPAGDAGPKSFDVPILADADAESPESFALSLSQPTGGAALTTPSNATVDLADDDTSCDVGACVEDANTLCLNGARFKVQVTWTDFQANVGPAFAVPYTADSGFFYFFGPENLEILLKVLNACDPPFERYWVFFAVASNVEYTITVTDTVAGQCKSYFNPLNVFAPATGDTDAFATCP